jgi:hypothetical protein
MLIVFVLMIPDNDPTIVLAYLQDATKASLNMDWIKLNKENTMAHSRPRNLIYCYVLLLNEFGNELTQRLI